ncbi:MAG: hypothetical protein E7254_04860 [Lachnospiraceae bacterium]|nr:hypothetical protein [Lachnospiraceae bacterium]
MANNHEVFLDEKYKYGPTRSKDYDSDWENLFNKKEYLGSEDDEEKDIKTKIIDEQRQRDREKDKRGSLLLADFKLAEGETKLDLRKKQSDRRFEVFLVRTVIILIVVTIGVCFQLAARRSLPHWFKKTETDMYFITAGMIVFCVAEILSYLQLCIVDYILFDIGKNKVAYLRVIQKNEVEYLSVFRNKWRYIFCAEGNDILEDKIQVRGVILYRFIKKGDMVYVGQMRGVGKHWYYFLG